MQSPDDESQITRLTNRFEKLPARRRWALLSHQFPLTPRRKDRLWMVGCLVAGVVGDTLVRLAVAHPLHLPKWGFFELLATILGIVGVSLGTAIAAAKSLHKKWQNDEPSRIAQAHLDTIRAAVDRVPLKSAPTIALTIKTIATPVIDVAQLEQISDQTANDIRDLLASIVSMTDQERIARLASIRLICSPLIVGTKSGQTPDDPHTITALSGILSSLVRLPLTDRRSLATTIETLFQPLIVSATTNKPPDANTVEVCSRILSCLFLLGTPLRSEVAEALVDIVCRISSASEAEGGPDKETLEAFAAIVGSFLGLPDQARPKVPQAIGCIAKAWGQLVSRESVTTGSTPRTQLSAAILRDLLEAYAKLEASEVGGSAGLEDESAGPDAKPANVPKYHRLHTSYLGYAQLVEAVVQAGRRSNHARNIVFFTTQTMPLPKFFNYSPAPPGSKPAPEFCLRQGDWDNYAELMMNLADRDSLCRLERCLLMYDPEASSDKDNSSASNDAVRSIKEIRSTGRMWILVAGASQPGHRRTALEPVICRGWLDAEDLFGRIHADEDLNALRAHYPDKWDHAAYLILPEDSLTTESTRLWVDRKGYHWRRVYDVYSDRFHKSPQDAFTYCVPNHVMQRGVLEDVFLVGIVNESNVVHWIACLSANVDRSLSHVSLELMTDNLNSSKFDQIKLDVDDMRRSKGEATYVGAWFEYKDGVDPPPRAPRSSNGGLH